MDDSEWSSNGAGGCGGGGGDGCSEFLNYQLSRTTLSSPVLTSASLRELFNHPLAQKGRVITALLMAYSVVSHPLPLSDKKTSIRLNHNNKLGKAVSTRLIAKTEAIRVLLNSGLMQDQKKETLQRRKQQAMSRFNIVLSDVFWKVWTSSSFCVHDIIHFGQKCETYHEIFSKQEKKENLFPRRDRFCFNLP